MAQKVSSLMLIALAALTLSGCQTPYSGGCSGGCCGGSCAAPTATYAPYQSDAYVPSMPATGGYTSGGSGTR